MDADVEELLLNLVAIDSVNPSLSKTAKGEAEIARFIADWLERQGLEVRLEHPAAGRPNVIARLRGAGGGRTLLLNGHMDTVGVEGMERPFEPFIKDGRLYGRGAYDMKGGLAGCMAALADLQGKNLRGDVIFTGVVDEEYASLGTAALAKTLQADGAIVAEFTELRLGTAHKGFIWMEVETTGTAAHGSRPDLGVDAIAAMGHILTGLESLNRDLLAHPSHPLLGSGSLHSSFIEGGVEPSTYPARCLLTYERRTIPGETPGLVQGEAQSILDRLSDSDPNFRAIARQALIRAPMETPPDAEILMITREAAETVLRRKPEEAGVAFWTDAALLSEAGIPSLLFGPAGAGAHSTEEWVDLESVRLCKEVYLETARRFCA